MFSRLHETSLHFISLSILFTDKYSLFFSDLCSCFSVRTLQNMCLYTNKYFVHFCMNVTQITDTVFVLKMLYGNIPILWFVGMSNYLHWNKSGKNVEVPPSWSWNGDFERMAVELTLNLFWKVSCKISSLNCSRFIYTGLFFTPQCNMLCKAYISVSNWKLCFNFIK